MDLRAFLPPLARATNIADQDLLERDVRLHLLLREILADPFLLKNLVFKGGTLLIKALLEYARFSEDLDFTLRHQPRIPEGRGGARRKPFDDMRRRIVEHLEAAARRVGLERRAADLKVDREGQLVTIRYSHTSATGAARFVKVEVSLFEPLLYEPVTATAKSLLPPPPPAALLLADEALARAYTTPIEAPAYDPREVRAEKLRALVTRGAVRGRDVHDLYELDRRGLPIEDGVNDAGQKIRFSIAHWDRYRVNEAWREQVEAAARDGEVARLALRAVDEAALDAFTKRLEALVPDVLRSATAGRGV